MAASILFVGDLVGSPGRRTLLGLLDALREELRPTWVVVNGENSAGGLGITTKIAEQLLDAGVDAITLGNHAFHQKEVFGFLDRDARIVRPANYLRSNPGRGETVVEARDGSGLRLGVLNLSGNVSVQAAYPAFAEADAAVARLTERCDHLLVDFHAEFTSEKVAMGWHLDGRATAVVGTHTHIPTADARVLPGGTAYVTDVGMTGARGGVIGVRRDQALEQFTTQMKVRFETSEDDPWLNAVHVTCADEPRRASAIAQVLRPAR